MRIGINARTLGTDTLRGWSRYTLNLARELSHMGVDVYLFSDRTINEKWLQGFDEDKTHVHLAKGFYYIDWEQVTLPNLCREHKVDILHCPINYGLPLQSPCKKVLTMHDAIDVAFYGRYKTFWQKLAPKHLYSQWLNYISRSATDRVITVSEFSSRDIQRYYGVDPEKIEVIYEAADPVFSHENVQPLDSLKDLFVIEKPYFFYVGGLEQRKNILFLIKAFAELENDSVQLVIGGGQDEEIHQLQEFAKSLELGDKVKFLGSVEDRHLPTLYAHAHCFVYPSLYEGFGLQLVEAMTMGTPILSSRASCLPEVLGLEEALFDPHNHGELVTKMKATLDDEGFYQQLKNHSESRGKEYSWNKTAEKTLQLYRSL